MNGDIVIRDNAWLDWYHSQHEKKWLCGGDEFEKYVSQVLNFAFDDFFNPEPVGSMGDGGCDGIADGGRLFFACYGQTGNTGLERKTLNKLKNDFTRAVQQWPNFEVFHFITNGLTGKEFGLYLIEQANCYDGKNGQRKIILKHADSQYVWNIIRNLTQQEREQLFPGCPHNATIEMTDVLPLIEALYDEEIHLNTVLDVKEVPPSKMEYNDLPVVTRAELNEGRRFSLMIREYFDASADTELEDKCSASFRMMYERHREVTKDSSEIISRLHVDLVGSNPRHDAKMALALHAVIAYFFDICSIFDEPPVGWRPKKSLAQGIKGELE